MKNSGTDLLTYPEAVAYCRLKSEYKLRVAVRRRWLQIVRIGPRTVRFERFELDRWMDSLKTPLRKHR